MHNATTNRSIVGRIAVGLIAAALLLGACGGDDGDAGPGAADDAAVDGGSDAASSDAASSDASSSDDDSDSSAEGVAPAPEGPSGGLQLDDAWPEQVWIPSDVTITGGSFGIADDGTYQASLFAVTRADLDDLRDALVGGNGTPDSEREQAAMGAYHMSYHDLLPDHDVGFQLIGDAEATSLVVTIYPS